MKASKNCYNLIKKFEGCKLSTYLCPVGKLTIGYGHCGSDVKKGMTISQKKADSLLKKDVAKFEKHVNSYLKFYDFTQNEFDALVSFAFNIGNINQLTANGTRSINTIAEKMLLYVNANNVRLDGLVKRRKAEYALFTKKESEYYTVQKGDCLSKIGEKLGIDWKKIATLNNIKKPYTIYVGQRLKLPN